jgi:hypothetical protein
MHPRVKALLRIMSRTLRKQNCHSKRSTPNCRSLTNGIPMENFLIPCCSCLQQSGHPRIVRSTVDGPHWASCSHASTKYDRNAPARIKSSSGGAMAPIKICDGNITVQRNPTRRSFKKHPPVYSQLILPVPNSNDGMHPQWERRIGLGEHYRRNRSVRGLGADYSFEGGVTGERWLTQRGKLVGSHDRALIQ